MENMPRGIRNNNPGNIDYNRANKWKGQLGLEVGTPKPRFARFDTPENGIRAIAKLLLGYHRKGFTTVAAMINRWAPPVENDTGSYAHAVAKRLGVKPDQPITLDYKTLVIFVTAIIMHENGMQPYSVDQIWTGVTRAFV